MCKYNAVVFDLDGTLLNTLTDLTLSVNYALNAQGFPIRTNNEIRSFVGNGIKKLIECSVPLGADDEQIKGVYNRFTAHYTAHCADNTAPYEGICELLDNLKEHGIKTAVVSNKADYAVKTLCDTFFAGKFDFVSGSIEGVAKKPSPELVNKAVAALKTEKNKTVYVGDSEVDIKTAQNANLKLICVDWGFRDREVLMQNGAEIIVSNNNRLMREIFG